MRPYNTNIKHVNPFLVVNISLYVLAALCFMIYTTEQSYTFAEGEDEDLGYDITSANASVTVGTACTFTATVDSEHNATIANGIYSTDIGKTTLNTICNDSGGYAVYAIGYSNDEYGATDLTSDISSTYNISTGTNTSGDSSSWAMKLAQEPGTTTATIENGYNNYNIVPDDYTKVATLNTITDPGSSTSGSSISTTYQTYISPTQPAGTYTGKVKYTLVHPSTAPAPVFMQDTAKIKTLLTNYGDTMQAIDKRDGKKYWITKLADGNIWMTQNLDLDIETGRTYTSADTDLPESAIWTPSVSTYTDNTWNGSEIAPESYDPGNKYWDGNITDSGGTINDRTVANQSDSPGGAHYHIGNYYNWTAAMAMNDSSMYSEDGSIDQSICPAGWRNPSGLYVTLIGQQSLTAGIEGNIQASPVYLIYGGSWQGSSGLVGERGYYWYGTYLSRNRSYYLTFNSSGYINSHSYSYRNVGLSLRCIIR